MYDFRSLKNRLFRSKLVNDSFWAIFGNIIAKGLALAAGIIVARFLGKEIFGEYGIIRNTLMSIAIFSTFGLGYTATKYVAEYKNSKPEYLRLILRYSRNITLAVSGLMAAGLFITAGYVAEIILEAPHLIIPLRLVAVWIVFNAVTTTQIGILAGFGAFKGMARINTIVGVFTFIVSTILTYFYQLNGALAALLSAQIINWYLNYNLVQKNLPVENNQIIKQPLLLKDIFKFSLPIALQEALYSITTWLTSLIIIKFSDYGQLGLYSAAMHWNAIILFIPGILRNVILTHFAEVSVDEKLHTKVLKTTLLINFTVTFILSIIIFFLADIIVSFYGNSFYELKNIITLAVFITIFTSMSNVYTQAYISKSKNWLMFKLKFMRDIGIIFMTYILISKGLQGAFALILSNLILNMIFFILIAIIYNKLFTSNKRI